MIGFVMVLLLLIALGNQLYVAWLTGAPIIAFDLLKSLEATLLIGIFPTVVSVLTTYIVKLRSYTQSAQNLSPMPGAVGMATDVSDKTSMPLTLSSDTGKDEITLKINDLLFIESSENYATVVYLKQNTPTRALLRNTLSRLESQANQPDVVRCHRSFVVNLNQIERVTGNAQGYKLHLVGGSFVVPVARQYNATIVTRLKK